MHNDRIAFSTEGGILLEMADISSCIVGSVIYSEVKHATILAIMEKLQIYPLTNTHTHTHTHAHTHTHTHTHAHTHTHTHQDFHGCLPTP